MLESIAFAELVAFVKDQTNNRSASGFKFADLIQVYEQQLKTLGVLNATRVHSTRFKQRLMTHCPGLEAFTKGKDVMLAFLGGHPAKY